MSKTFRNTTGVGFSQPEGTIKKRVTRQHTPKDYGKTFVDNYGKTYVQTCQGRIY